VRITIHNQSNTDQIVDISSESVALEEYQWRNPPAVKWQKKTFTKIPERETKTIFDHFLFYIFCNKS